MVSAIGFDPRDGSPILSPPARLRLSLMVERLTLTQDVGVQFTPPQP